MKETELFNLPSEAVIKYWRRVNTSLFSLL